jgi:hypothetical protein
MIRFLDLVYEPLGWRERVPEMEYRRARSCSFILPVECVLGIFNKHWTDLKLFQMKTAVTNRISPVYHVACISCWNALQKMATKNWHWSSCTSVHVPDRREPWHFRPLFQKRLFRISSQACALPAHVSRHTSQSDETLPKSDERPPTFSSPHVTSDPKRKPSWNMSANSLLYKGRCSRAGGNCEHSVLPILNA